MLRPCFLVVDREYPGSISTRKLVIETAKMNVLTAYSSEEALQMLERFPAVDGAVIDLGVDSMSCTTLIAGMRRIRAKLPIIVIAAPGVGGCDGADYELESFQPAKLLELIKTLTPEAMQEIEARNEQLSNELGSS